MRKISNNKQIVTLEEAFQKLNDIVNSIEEEDKSLEEIILLFQDGMKLSNLCQKKLKDAEKKINDLLKK